MLKVPPIPRRPVTSEQVGGRNGALQANASPDLEPGEPLCKPAHFSSPVPFLTSFVLGVSRSGILESKKRSWILS